jgi:large exoprotein involved in heme utilization and adhesion
MLNGATILAASFGDGKAGRVDITADSVNLLSGAIITAGTFGAANGGNVQITAGSMRIDGTDTLNGGADLLTGIQAVTTSSDFPAIGGDIQITAGTLELAHNASIFTTSYGIGPAGNISLHADRLIALTQNSSVSTSAPGSSGGNISVTSGDEIRVADSQITAAAGLDGGNIALAAPSLIYLLRSTVSAQADTTGSGFGNGGNLSIDPSFLILTDSGLISKSSFGNGGNITIQSDYFFQSTGIIDASAPFGLPGTVVVTAPEVDLSGALVALAGNFIDAAAQLRPDCGIRLTGKVSSFVVLGRGGLPLAPGGFVPSSTHESR